MMKYEAKGNKKTQNESTTLKKFLNKNKEPTM